MTHAPRHETITRLTRDLFAGLAMLAGMELDVFTPMKDGPMSAEAIATDLGVGPEKLTSLLYSLVGAELLTAQDGLFANSPEAERYLVHGEPDYMGWRHNTHVHMVDLIVNTVKSIRTGVPQAKEDDSMLSGEELESTYRRRHPRAVANARSLLQSHDFSGYQTMVDVGGGSGSVSMAITEACPGLKATVVDFPSVAPVARRYIEEAGASDRVNVIEADVINDGCPGTYDAAVLNAFVQVLSPGGAGIALKHVGDAVRPGGTIIIMGVVLDDTLVSPPEALRFGLALVSRVDEGRAYTEKEHRDWLDAAGFVGFQRVIRPDGVSVITARKRA